MFARILFRPSCRVLKRIYVPAYRFSKANFTAKDRRGSGKLIFNDKDHEKGLDNIPSQDTLVGEKLPDSKPKKLGQVLEDMLDLLDGRNTAETLEFVNRYSNTMNSHHVYRSFANIMRDLKNSDFDPNVIQSLRANENFQMLCVLAGKKATYFDAKHCSFMVKYLIHLGFNSDSILLRIFMELLKYHVNDLNLTHLSDLGHYLCKLDSTPQTDFLKKVFAVGVDNILKLEYQFLQSDKFISLLEAYGSLLNEDSLEFLLEQVTVRTNSRYFNRPETVLKSLAVLDRKETVLIQDCINICEDFLEQERFDQDQILDIVEALRHFGWYSQNLFEKIVKFVENSMMDHHDENDREWLALVCHGLMGCSYYPRSLVEKLYDCLKTADSIKMDGNDHKVLLEIFRDSEFLLDRNLEQFLPSVDLNIPPFDHVLDDNFLSDLNVVRNNLELCGIVRSETNNGQIIDVYYKDDSCISVFVLGSKDIFNNVAELKGPVYRQVQELSSQGNRVFILSLWKFRKLPESDRVGTLKVKLREVVDGGIAEFL